MQEDLPTTWREAADDILPVLRRSTDPPASVRAAVIGDGLRLISKPVGDFLEHRLVYNGATQFIHLNSQHLERWGVSAHECFAHAGDILDPTYGIRQIAEGLWKLDTGDGLESSRPLIPGWLRAFQPFCRGTPLVFIPHARRVLVADSASTQAALTAWQTAAREFETEGSPLSPRAYVEHPSRGLEPWTPEDDHPLVSCLQDALRRISAYEYNNQRYALHGNRPELAKVESVWLPAKKRLVTLCWWEEGTNRLLAPVDYLGLRSQDGLELFVPWDSAVFRLSPLWLGLEWRLPRFQTLGWPDEATLMLLRNELVTLEGRTSSLP